MRPRHLKFLEEKGAEVGGGGCVLQPPAPSLLRADLGQGTAFKTNFFRLSYRGSVCGFVCGGFFSEQRKDFHRQSGFLPCVLLLSFPK